MKTRGSSVGRRSVQRSLATVGLLGGLIIAPACRDLVAGDNLDALARFCERLDDCTPDSDASLCSDLAGRFERADPELQASALARLGTECLDGHCGVVVGCADEEPFCVSQGSGCERDSDCCDATLGYFACGVRLLSAAESGDQTPAGNCCAKRGRPCDASDDCCAPERCSEVNTGDGVVTTCGGVICQEVGEPCSTAGDCCTGSCLGEVCVTGCVPLGGPCAGDASACCVEEGREVECLFTPDPEPGQPPKSFCALKPPPECSFSGQECSGEGGCCDPREVCDVVEGNLQECCLPAKADCGQDYECCSGECALVGAQFVCTQNPCVADEQPCTEPTDCCTGYCDPVAQICADPSCPTDCNASPCDVGPGKADCTLADPLSEQALQEVLSEDVVCRCDWDSFCVTAFDAKTMGSVCGP
jgi:hypothetical protein